MSKPEFEFCALRFLTQWQESESALFKAIRNPAPTEENIRRALAYFQVARSFKGINDAGNTAFIRKSLINVREREALSSPEARVDSLARKFETRFHQRNVSAASKLLWLSERDPFIIYDTRAIRALSRDFGYEFTQGTYGEYSKAWRAEYTNHKYDIKHAVEKLPKARLFMRNCALSDHELLKMVKKTWFRERVFDIFLWEVGEDKRSISNRKSSKDKHS